MIESLLAQTEILNVAQPVENGERLAVLKHPRTVIGKRRGRENVKLILNLNYVFQSSGYVLVQQVGS